MSRKLKFRVWDIPNQCWSDLFHTITDDGALWHFPNSGLAERDDAEQYTVEQYIGLEDRNGEEIYEGDIVEVAGVGVSRVIQSGWGEWQLCDLTNSDGNILSLGYCLGQEYCEVIGNIHENPELLGGKE